MTTLLIGTTNKGKLREFEAILGVLAVDGVTLASLRDVGLDSLELEEPYATFAGNARHKAGWYAQKTGLIALADDSGLVVDALDGRPGVYSARYAPGTDADRIAKLLGELDGVPDERRTARFVCAVAVVDPEGERAIEAEGVVEGRIAHEPTGTGGFGYDPIFIPEGSAISLSAMGEEKHAISHRGRAARAALDGIRGLMAG